MSKNNIYSILISIGSMAVLSMAACTAEGPGMGDSECYSPLLPVSTVCADCQPGNPMQAPVWSAPSLSRTDPVSMSIGGRTFYSFPDLYPTPINPDYTTIGVVLKPQAGGDAVEGNFYYKSEGKWETSVNVSTTDYYLFGFMPAALDASSQMFVEKRTIDATPQDYDKGAVITVTNFPALTPADVSVVVGVLKGTDPSLDITDASLLTHLQESYGKYVYSGSASNNYVYLLLDHLYANVNFELYVDKDYSKLRQFVLKGVEMTSSINNLVNLSVEVGNSVAGDAASLDPVKNITIESVPGTIPAVTQLFPLGTEGSETTKIVVEEVEAGVQTYTSIPGYFAPADNKQSFTFTFTFDVYDKKGNLIRENSKASNTWSLNDIKNPTVMLSHGVSYRVKVKIKPTYLYQLGEADLDTPSVIVNP